MPSEPMPSQSISISVGQLSDVQIGGLAGRNLTVSQSQQMGKERNDKPLASADM